MKHLFLTAALALAGSVPATASIIVYNAALSSANENPPTGTGGTGFAIVTIDSILNTMEVNVTFSGLSSPNTAAHIHCCIAPPGNTGVATITPTFTDFPSGTTSGTYDHIFDLGSSGTYNPAFVTLQGSLANAESALLAGLANGQTYLNIHTTNFGGGEIRGVLVATPEPSSYLLAGVSLTLLVAGIRRRRVRYDYES
jgi:hypothetical protein